MKRVLAVIAIATLAAGCASPGDTHDHAGGMQGMHGHMKLMREQMAQIRAATDPKERERLMSEHMSSMEQSMSRMQGMMGCGKM